MVGDATPPGERPRWSFTWLVRLQRVGRNKPTELQQEGAKIQRNHTLLLVILVAVVGAETIVLVLLDVLPLTP